MVGIIILNYKGWKDTVECIESIQKQTLKDYKIILVDNSEGNEDVDHIKLWASGECTDIKTGYPSLIFPQSKKPIVYDFVQENDLPDYKGDSKFVIVKANKNRGFAAGNNIGIKLAMLDHSITHFWLLNNDTVIGKAVLLALIQYYKSKDAKLGILGAVLRYYHNASEIQAVGGVLNKFFGTVRHVLNPNEKIEYPVGASMFVSREYIEKVGCLNENYFLYYEELDWVLRGEKKGFYFDIMPDVEIYHKEGASTNANSYQSFNRSFISDYSCLHSRVTFMKLFYPKKIFSVKLGLCITVVNRLRRGEFKIIPSIMKLILR